MTETSEQTEKQHDLRHSFLWMAWAFVFLFPFPLQPLRAVTVDFLPNVVGWLLFARGLRLMGDASPRADGLRRILKFLIVLSLFEFVVPTVAAYETAIRIVTLATLVLEIVFVWGLFQIVADFAAETGRPPLQRSARMRRVTYIVCIVLALAAQAPSVLLESNLKTAAIFYAGLSLRAVALSMAVDLMRRMALVFGPGGQPSPSSVKEDEASQHPAGNE